MSPHGSPPGKCERLGKYPGAMELIAANPRVIAGFTLVPRRAQDQPEFTLPDFLGWQSERCLLTRLHPYRTTNDLHVVVNTHDFNTCELRPIVALIDKGKRWVFTAAFIRHLDGNGITVPDARKFDLNTLSKRRACDEQYCGSSRENFPTSEHN